MNFGGPLALVSKINVKEVCFDGEEGIGEEGFIMNSDDEVVTYYLNNKVKKFYKKPMNSIFKKILSRNHIQHRVLVFNTKVLRRLMRRRLRRSLLEIQVMIAIIPMVRTIGK